MRHYELMLILDNETEERTLADTVDKLMKVVPAENGIIDNVDIWGRRRFAYDIQKKSEGFYVVVDFHAEPKTTKELDRQLGLNESVLRTKILRPDAK
ncbi:30S ribosomal protein S6 [Brevibacterium aurantiacum]|uniref:Small ribosomal subunit protein bS6 n=1 Tax=Brevibacterium aurantiacum TaxID=273384 RepID=A0A2A3YXZ1_BREAU|nr:30S ribosomal protein S6 [Brevibacterium aurantiacum]PCC44186.1 30S ribosomal protein S6 [Brevibacterium aurantiacum]